MSWSARPPIAIYALRWSLGLLFTVSGLAKLIPGFPNTMGPVDLEVQLAPYGLALFGRFVALSELAAGLLLLTRRFATIGTLVLLPMLASIVVITTSLRRRGTPVVAGVFLAMNLALILYDLPKLAPLLGERANDVTARQVLATHRPAVWWLLALGGVLVLPATWHLSTADGPAVLTLLLLLAGLVVADWWSAHRDAPTGQPALGDSSVGE